MPGVEDKVYRASCLIVPVWLESRLKLRRALGAVVAVRIPIKIAVSVRLCFFMEQLQNRWANFCETPYWTTQGKELSVHLEYDYNLVTITNTSAHQKKYIFWTEVLERNVSHILCIVWSLVWVGVGGGGRDVICIDTRLAVSDVLKDFTKKMRLITGWN